MSSPGDPVAAAEARWNGLLYESPQAAEGLREWQWERGLIENGKPLCRVARPVFVTRAHVARQRAIVDALIGALQRARDYVVAGRNRMVHLGALREWVEALIRLEVADVDHGEIARLDGFMGPDGLHFVEANSDIPGGTGHADGIAAAFEALPFWSAFRDEFGATITRMQPLMLRTLLDSWRRWGGRGDPRLAVVGWRNLYPAMDALMETNAGYASAHGLQAVECEPSELSWEGHRLLARDQPVDLVFRAMLVRDVTGRMNELAPLVHALRADAVCMVNSFRSELMGHKALFAMLTDPDVSLGLTAVQRAVIRAHVPWGRLLRQGETTAPDGRRVDLVPWILKNRERLVLKPTHSAASQGVVLGWTLTQQAWESNVDAAIDSDHVVQLRTSLPRRKFPLSRAGLPERCFVQDTDPFVFNGRLGSFLTRLSLTDITNVTTGGSLAPTVILARVGEGR